MSLSQNPYLARFHNKRLHNYGQKRAWLLSILVHGLMVAGLWGLHVEKDKKPEARQVMTVGIAPPMVMSRAGKETKAPVVRSSKNTVTKPKPKPENKPPVKKTEKKEVALKKKTEPKKKPPPKQEEPTPPVVSDEPEPVVQPEKTPQNLGGTGGAEESGISFDVARSAKPDEFQEVEFQAYYNAIHDTIARRWTRGNLKGGRTVISFEIQRDGTVANVEISESSGKAYLDGPAKRAVLGSRLPPLPQGFKGDRLLVAINFKYE